MLRNKVFKCLYFSFFMTVVAWEFLYFSLSEGFVLGISLYISFYFVCDWYKTTKHVAQFYAEPKRSLFFYCLPLVPVILYLLTFTTVASYDVVDSIPYILFYLVIGIAWQAISLEGMLLFWSFSYRDDVLLKRNTAAFLTLAGGILANGLIFSGANVGDGPGWFSVLFASGLGTLTWLLLGAVVNKLVGFIEAILERNYESSIRFTAYLIAAAMILSKASSGAWTSLGVTMLEFLVGWPVLLLTGIVVFIETLFKRQRDQSTKDMRIWTWSISLFYLLFSLVVLLTGR